MDDNDQFKFSQVFNICPNGQGGLYVHNDIFTIVMWFVYENLFLNLLFLLKFELKSIFGAYIKEAR